MEKPKSPDSLIRAVESLTAEIKQGFEWFRSCHGLATKNDLKQMEKRIVDSISVSRQDTQAVAAIALRASKIADRMTGLRKRLEFLDAQTDR